MNTYYKTFLVIIFIFFFPLPSLAAVPKIKTITGIVSRVVDTQVVITSGNGNTYYVQTANANLMRRYGSPMTLDDILTGDKLEVTGVVGSSNIIPAVTIKSLVLYTHTGVVTGKIISTNLSQYSFTIEDTQLVKHTVQMDSRTSIKKNSAAAVITDIETGMKVTTKGTWERTNANITAKEVLLTQRLIAIEITGTLSMRGPEALTVIGTQGALYGIDIRSAKIVNKKGNTIPYSSLTMGGKVRIVGKHVSGKQQIVASQVKDYGE